MKITETDTQVQVLEENCSPFSILEEISEIQEEAFFVADLGDVVDKFIKFKAAMPRVIPFYAIKCNNHKIILQILMGLGAGFDCASKQEIMKMQELGVHPSRIIFANPTKLLSHIQYAAEAEVDLMTFDNECELFKTKKLFPNAKLVIRIRCDALVAKVSLGNKFGCNPVTEAPDLLKLAKNLGLNVVGVSFHVGSDCGEPGVFDRAISKSRKIFDFAKNLGFNFNLLDIGGGFPGTKKISIDQFAAVVNKSLDEYFPDPSVTVIAEPGRYFVESAYTLACSVHTIKSYPSNSTIDNIEKHIMYYINDGLYGSFFCALYHNYIIDVNPLKSRNGKYYSSSVWGPTCDGYDKIVDNKLIPELKVGDWLIFEEAGAYTLTMATEFNGFPPPKVHYVCDKSNWSVLKQYLPESSFLFGISRANLLAGLN